jgi:hypothetical protein
MPTQYVPLSDDEQRIAALIDRIFTDKKFAQAMSNDPATALQSAGYKLTARDKQRLKNPKVFSTSGSEAEISLSFVRPAVRILTRGTRPVVRVITKGTQPAVSVATNTVISARERDVKTPSLIAQEETRKKKSTTRKKRGAAKRKEL